MIKIGDIRKFLLAKNNGSMNGELIIYEKDGNPDDGYVLLGWDEVGTFDSEFENPVYGIAECRWTD